MNKRLQKHSMLISSVFKKICVLLMAFSCFSSLPFAAAEEVQAGSLQVTIEPSEARNEGACWRRAGTLTWYESGRAETGIPDGTYAVEFLDLRFWTEPAVPAVTIDSSSAETLNVMFIECGDLKVTIAPAEAVAAGAQWRRVGTTTWQNSDYTEPNVPVGKNTVEFKAIPGYAKPANMTKNVNKNKNYGAIRATYSAVPCGELTVSIYPAGAVAAGAKWRRIKADGTTTAWFPGGYTETGIAAFTYLIEFMDLTGWVAPAWQSVAIADGTACSAAGFYAQRTGTFQTVIYPAGAVSAGARWSLDAGATWLASGTTLTGLEPGSYTITYKSISGWSAPHDQTVKLLAGGSVSAVSNYVQLPGTLQVVINPPEAASAGAQWSIDAGATWHASGITLTGLSSGSFTVSFSPLPGWTKPSDQSVSLPLGGFASAAGVYIQEAGSFAVAIIPPEAVCGGAQWSIDAGASWNDSAAIVSGIEPGGYVLSFKDLTGWDTPSDQSVTILQNVTTSALGSYVQQPGTLQVIISPAAVLDRAQWSIDGGITWHYSGETLTGLTAADYTVVFSAVPGYGTPVDQVYPFEAGEAATVRGYYTTTWYRDADGDGFGDPAVSLQSAFQPEGYVLDATDCDDTDSSVSPGAQEVCNAKDDNCNAEIDEYSGPFWYWDEDGDSHGSPFEIMQACAQPAGYVADGTDCDDTDAAVHPEAGELCNGLDDNCNGQIDEGCTEFGCIDEDGDGYGAGDSCLGPDCDDSDASVHDQCTECAVKIFPRRISRLLSIIKPICSFIILKEDKTAFAKKTQVAWQDDSIKTLASFALGKNKRILYVIVFIKPRILTVSSDYSVKVSDCDGTIAIKRF